MAKQERYFPPVGPIPLKCKECHTLIIMVRDQPWEEITAAVKAHRKSENHD